METTEVWRYSFGVWSTQWLTRNVPDAVVDYVADEGISKWRWRVNAYSTANVHGWCATLDEAKAAAEEALQKRRGEK